MTAYSGGVATSSSVLLSLSATTWMLRTMPVPAVAPGACGPAGVAGGRWTWIMTCGCVTAGCGWNCGGDRRSCRPVSRGQESARSRRGRCAAGKRLLQQRREFLGARVLQVVHVEARTFALARLIEARDPFLRLVEIRGLRRDDEKSIQALERDDPQDSRERTVLRSPIALSSSAVTVFTSAFSA